MTYHPSPHRALGEQTERTARVTVPLLPLSASSHRKACWGGVSPSSSSRKLHLHIKVLRQAARSLLPQVCVSATRALPLSYILSSLLLAAKHVLSGNSLLPACLPARLHKHMNTRENQSAQLLQQQAKQTRCCWCSICNQSEKQQPSLKEGCCGKVRQLRKPGGCSRSRLVNTEEPVSQRHSRLAGLEIQWGKKCLA